MLGPIETDIAVALVVGLVTGIVISALIWLCWPRERVDEALVSGITQPAIDDRLYQIETNGEEDLRKLAAQQGVAFDGAGDPGEPQPYKARDIPF